MRKGLCHIYLGLVATAFLVGVLTPAQAQDTPYQAMFDRFFELLQQGKASEAVQYLTSTNPAMSKIPDQIEQLKTQFSSAGPLMGTYVSHKLLVESKVADMYVYQHYFVAYERQPVSIRIAYYKPGKTWMCYGLRFDARPTEEIQTQTDANLPLNTK